MPNLNKTMLMGNLTRDPEMKYTPKGTAVAELGMAINRVWNNDQGQKQEETTFIDVTYFGRTAEVIGAHCQKGQPLYVEGRLQLDSWDDKETGKKRTKLRIIGEHFQFLTNKQDGQREYVKSPEHGNSDVGGFKGRQTTQGGAKPPLKDDSWIDSDEPPF